jgi:hypothetical protein
MSSYKEGDRMNYTKIVECVCPDVITSSVDINIFQFIQYHPYQAMIFGFIIFIILTIIKYLIENIPFRRG